MVVWATVYDRASQRPRKLLGAVGTGASSVIVPPNVVRALGYDLQDAPTERIVTGKGVLDAPKIALGRVDVGVASATDVEAVCHDLPAESLIDVLVGLSFLTRFDIRFDFDAWEMELLPRG